MTTVDAAPTTSLRRRYRDDSLDSPRHWNPVLETILEHRSVRSYLPDDVDSDTVNLLVAAAQSAPSSSNLQVWSVVAVRDVERKARLASLAGDQSQIEQAPVLLVWLADFARLRQLAADRDLPLDGADYLESSYVGVIDAALAAQNAVTAAESLGLGTVYIGAIRNHPEEVARELGLPPHVFAVFGLVVGHPDPGVGSSVKPRLPLSAVLHHERYDLDVQREHVDAYEERIGGFYAEQQLEHSWTSRVLARLANRDSLNGRHRLRESLAAMGFRLT